MPNDLHELQPGAWRLVEIGTPPGDVTLIHDERASRTLLEVGGQIVGWVTDQQKQRGAEVVVDWNALDEGLRLLASPEEG